MVYTCGLVFSFVFLSFISALNEEFFIRKRLICGLGEIITLKSRSISLCSAECAKDAACGGVKYESGLCKLVKVANIPFFLNFAGISDLMAKKNHNEGMQMS